MKNSYNTSITNVIPIREDDSHGFGQSKIYSPFKRHFEIFVTVFFSIRIFKD